MSISIHRLWSSVTLLTLSSVLIAGCASAPPPRTIFQDAVTSIQVRVDDRTSRPHTHPTTLSSEQIAAILKGVRVVARKGFVESAIGGRATASAAFSLTEVRALAGPISQALAAAKPDELVTFYRRFSDQSVGLAMTSGGLFVQDNHLYFILANNRNQPADGMNMDMTYAIDPLESPLLPIARNSFRAAYASDMVVVPVDERMSWPYVDEGRLLVLDLAQLTRELKRAATATVSQP